MSVKIKNKKDAEQWVEAFESNSSVDLEKNKRYYIIEDKQRNGTWTIMKYPQQTWSVHGIGEDYCDAEEMMLNEDQIIHFVWKNRAAVNKTIT